MPKKCYNCKAEICVSLIVSLTSILIFIRKVFFCSTKKVTDIFVDPENSFFSTLDGVLFNKDLTELIAFPNGKGTSYNIPDSVIKIGQHSFEGTNLSEVLVGNQVTSIGEYAFSGTNLSEVSIGNQVIYIGERAFSSTPLFAITLGDKVERIDKEAFKNCENLSSIYIPASVKYIASDSFDYTPLGRSLYLYGVIPQALKGVGRDSVPEDNGSLDPSEIFQAKDIHIIPIDHNGKVLYDLFCRMPDSKRTLDVSAADYFLITHIDQFQNNNYVWKGTNKTANVYDKYTTVYLCTPDGETYSQIFSVRHTPYNNSVTGAKNGDEATEEEIWEGIKDWFYC